MPSRDQEKAVAEIVADRREKLARFAPENQLETVAFSALRYYNLQALFAACLKSAPLNRRWMFELLKSFSTQDWLDRAKGLTAAQKQQMASRYINTDARLKIDRIPR